MASVTGLTANRMKDIEAIVNSLEGKTPGTELAYAEKRNNFSTTKTGTGNLDFVTGLSIALTGHGRAVDIEVFLPRVYHSVANAGTMAALYGIQTGAGSTWYQIVESATPFVSGDYGAPIYMKMRKVLPDESSWTFAVYIQSIVAGTSTVVCSGYSPGMISAVSR